MDTGSLSARAIDAEGAAHRAYPVFQPAQARARLGSAPPTPSSTIATWSDPLQRHSSTRAWEACAYFATLASDSDTTK